MLKEIGTQTLKLDLENPRFGLSDAKDETEALALLRDRANLKELWDSIAEKGFERYEPLVAYRDKKRGLVVIEGNRRLAAVKLLRSPKLATSLGIRNLPSLTAKIRATMTTLPVTLVKSRDAAADYIGFKHINGPASWGSLAKAKFGVALFDKLKVAKSNEDTRLQVLSKRLGDSRQLLLRTLVGYKVFEQARDLGFLGEDMLDESAFDFSHLYTMLQNPATREFLGLGSDPLSEGDIRNNPTPKSHQESLQHLMSWLFGNGDDEPSLIKRQGTDRPKLTKILASAVATETLISTRDFDRAADEAGFSSDRWFSRVITLETTAKSVADGVSDLPEDVAGDELKRAQLRLDKAHRHVRAAISQVKSLF
ncbi:MAG: ParB/Srx family N-terminal domain-containing protein [Devosia sp.]